MALAGDDPLAEAQALLAAQRARPDAARFERAKGIAEAEVARAPGAARAWTLLAWARMIEHRFADALAAARTADGLAPDDARTLALMSDALVELGRYDEAIAVTQRLADTSPGVPAWIRAAHIRFLYGDLDGAIGLMAMAARAGSPHAEETAWTWLDLARLELHAGDLAAAGGALAAAQAAFPALPGLPSAKARLQLAEGNNKAALDLLRESLRAQTNAEDALLAWRLAQQMGEEGSVRHFAALLDALARLDTLGLSRRTLAEYFAETGEQPRALALARQEFEARPDIYSHAILATVLQRAGEAALARDHARRALALGTADRQLRVAMGAILAASGAGAPEERP
jgi:tetratricopeptide (TPR) repeat protein